MAASLVQVLGPTNGTSTTATTVPAGGVALGSHLVVCHFSGGSSTVTNCAVSDTGGNTYQLDRQLELLANQLHAWVFSAKVTTALVSGNTITVSSSSGNKRSCILNFSGLDATTWVDGTVPAGSTGTSTTPAQAVTTSTSDGVVVGACAYKLTTPGYAQNSGFTEDDDAQTNTAQQSCETQHQITTSAASYTTGGTITSAAWAQIAVAYKGAAGAAFTKPPGRIIVQQAVKRSYTY